jgi:hypothetical protein
MKEVIVKLKSTDSLAGNIKPNAVGKLIKVSEKIIEENKYYILENSKGIRFKVLAYDCEIKKSINKKTK